MASQDNSFFVLDLTNGPKALSSTELNHKIRLLTLAALAFKHVGQNLPYSKIAEAIQIQPSEVEKWTIDGKYPSPFLDGH